MARVSFLEFEQLVHDALQSLPSQFRQLLENIVVIVEDEPTAQDYEQHDMTEEEELLGVFRGIPRSQISHNMLPALPNQIAIFRGPILRTTSSRAEAIQEVRDTVIHELGHYFGLDDERMPY